MKILSHRGYWQTAKEKNTMPAFQRSFSSGFGTETDLRDHHQQIVIAHDMATGEEMTLETLLALASTFSRDVPLTLALNIKADGLAPTLKAALSPYTTLDCFVFDMATPDMSRYFEVNLPVFTRMSEVEKDPIWFERSAGVWLDSFDTDWFDTSLIWALLKEKKRVCVVSPELNCRAFEACWEILKPLAHEPQLLLCTDFPEAAATYFFSGGESNHD